MKLMSMIIIVIINVDVNYVKNIILNIKKT